MPIQIERYKRVVVLTGAGISVSAGLRPYRGPRGLWEEEGTAKFSTADSITSDPEGVWKFWGGVRLLALEANPTETHKALAAIEKSLKPDQKLTVITQNIDGLHQRAGSLNVVELHGSIFRTRCSSSNCKSEAYEDKLAYDSVPSCTKCGAVLRPDIVMFNEMLPVDAEWNSKRSLRDCDLFIAIGTSGTVSPASRFVEWAKYAGAYTVLINLQQMTPPNRAFDQELPGESDTIVPSLFK